jgi:ubiquinone/menaquinone biosynthesis C-methylase UbiE
MMVVLIWKAGGMMIRKGWFRTRSRHLVLTLLVGSLVLVACHGRAQDRKDADKLAILLNWKPGSVVAEIGAGDGGLTLAAAERVGPTGRVYTTELEPQKLAKLGSLAAAQKAHNIIAVKAGEAETNLPPACCDSIFMRRVYHHFTQPEKEDASLFQSLKPGGLLAVIDFQPGEGPGDPNIPKGVPKNRGGHGMPKQLLIEELTAAGFEAVTPPTDWPAPDYCLVFRKP